MNSADGDRRERLLKARNALILDSGEATTDDERDKRRGPQLAPNLSDSGSIPYADADSDMNNCWDSSSGSEEAAPPPRTASLNSGVDCCSLNNLLDAIAEVDGTVSAAYSFSTLLDSDLDGECPSSSSGGGGRFGHYPQQQNPPPPKRGHTLPNKQRVRWVDSASGGGSECGEVSDGVELTPDELYYYCPTGPVRKHSNSSTNVVTHNNNGSLLKARMNNSAVRQQGGVVGVQSGVQNKQQELLQTHVEQRNRPRDKVGWGRLLFALCY
jgi:hypothetical protein